MESLLIQLKEEGTEKVQATQIKEYIVAWKSLMDTLQWWTDRKIKLMETMENQIFRDAIIEAIKQERHEVAERVKAIIERKREELKLV